VVNDLAPVVIDVRTPEEYSQGHIQGALLIDVSAADVIERLDRLDRSATYVVYCRSGNRSATATSAMLQLGFTSIFELDGGVIAWSAQGLPLVP
jgi:rhodanese-related sulfurtransferase